MTARTHDNGEVLLDDGLYFIECYPSRGRDRAGGCLMLRCGHESLSFGMIECVGFYEPTAEGKWGVTITTYYDARTDSEALEVGVFRNRLDAICTLWKNRHDAIGRYAN